VLKKIPPFQLCNLAAGLGVIDRSFSFNTIQVVGYRSLHVGMTTIYMSFKDVDQDFWLGNLLISVGVLWIHVLEEGPYDF
jgi:hypothetical protein